MVDDFSPVSTSFIFVFLSSDTASEVDTVCFNSGTIFSACALSKSILCASMRLNGHRLQWQMLEQ